MSAPRHFLLALVASVLVGCAGQGPAPQDTTEASGPGEERAQTSDGPITIETVWDEIGCEEDGPADSFGLIEKAADPVSRFGMCGGFGLEEPSFFYELENEAVARTWLKSGELEVGEDDSLFIEGGVVMLTTTPTAAAKFAETFTAIN